MTVQERSNSRLWLCLLAVAAVVRGGWLAADYRSLRKDPDTYRQLAQQLVAEGTFGYRMSEEAPRVPVVRGAPVPAPSVTDRPQESGRPAVVGFGEVGRPAPNRTGHRISHDTAARVRPTAYRPPLYPLVLAACGWVDDVGPASIAVLHAVAGIATVLLVYRVSQSWQFGRWGFWAAVLAACDPILLNQSSRVMTETLAALLAVLGLWGLTRLTAVPTTSRAMVAGVLVALAALCRPTFLVWGAAIALALLLVLQSPFRRRLWLAGSFVFAGGVVTAPWAARNALVFDRPIVTTTHGGYTLWLGNNEEFYGFLRQAEWGEVWDSRHLDEQYLRARRELDDDELRADRWAYDQAVASIRRDPAGFVRASVFRIGSLWGLVPHQVESSESAAKRFARYAVGVWYVGVFALALVGAGLLGRRWCDPPWLWGLLLCLSFTVMHAVYWSNLRMRAPLMPVVCLAAAFGAGAIVSRTWKSKTASP